MAEIIFLPRDFLNRVENWLGHAITFNDDIQLIVSNTGIDMGKVELEGTPQVRWSRAVARIALEGRFHHLLNGLALHAVNTAYASEIQQFSIEYDRLVASRMATDTVSLQKELNELINADETKSLARLSQKIRECVRQIRAQIDDDAVWPRLPFTSSGYAAEDVRDELSGTCLRVVGAADGLIDETRILISITDDPATQDPEAYVRRRRQQFGVMTQAKLTLADRGRSLIKAMHAYQGNARSDDLRLVRRIRKLVYSAQGQFIAPPVVLRQSPATNTSMYDAALVDEWD